MLGNGCWLGAAWVGTYQTCPRYVSRCAGRKASKAPSSQPEQNHTNFALRLPGATAGELGDAVALEVVRERHARRVQQALATIDLPENTRSVYREASDQRF